MPVDTSIYQNLLRPAPSPMDYANQYTQQAGAAQNLLLGRLKADEYQRGVQEQQQVRNALLSLGGGATDEQRVNALRGTGLPSGYKMADDLEKSVGERNYKTAQTKKETAEAAKVDVETQRHLYTYGVQMLQGAPDAQSAMSILQQGVGKGAWSMQQAQQSIQALQQAAQAGPDGVADWKRRQLATILAPKELLPNVQTRNTGGTTDTLAVDPLTGKATVTGSVRNTASPDALLSSQLGYARLGEEKRAHDMADARTREATAASMSKPFEVTGPDGTPILVQQDKQGNIRPVQGYTPKAGDKPLTESQAKANLFGTRMQEADKILTELTGKYSPATVNTKMSTEGLPLVGGVAGAIGNAMMSGDNQRAEQAQRDFINAVLRRESGATIMPSEFANAQKQYFPQPNDKPETLAQKARNRKLAIEGLMAEVPQNKRGVPTLSNPGGKPAPAASGWSITEVK